MTGPIIVGVAGTFAVGLGVGALRACAIETRSPLVQTIGQAPRSSPSELRPPPNFQFLRHCVRMIGLFGLPVAKFGAAIGWLVVGADPLSGPVVLELAPEHGVHLADPLAVVPFVMALGFLSRARGVWLHQAETRS